MIKELHIKNFAIIDSLIIKFDDRFNIITGETGAGKTLIIKAIDILLGAQFNKKMIRDSKYPLEISAEFMFNSEVLNISRIYKNEKSYSMLNNKRVPISYILDKFSSLVQFQRQHDSNDLLDNDKHINILDSYIEDKSIFNEVKDLFLTYIKNKKKYDKMVSNAEFYSDKLNLYKFQLEELDSINLDSNEEIKINEVYKKYVNSKEVIDTVNQYLDLNNSVSCSPIDNIEKSIKLLRKHQSVDKDINKTISRLEEILIDLKDIKDDVSNLESKYYFDAEDNKIVEDKILQYEEIKRKYGGSIESAIKYKQNLIEEFEDGGSFEEKIKLLKEKKQLSEEDYLAKSKELSKIRRKASLEMEVKINDYLSKVDMTDSKIKILINSDSEYRDSGIDRCEIYVITNKGEKYKPLAEIASGGEISRIMLSISLVLNNSNVDNTLIFDEVDTGISGSTASSMGDLLKNLSSKKQLIAITHLPQIASKADSHLYIYKKTDRLRSVSKLKKLNSEERRHEIARMLSGKQVTEHSLKQAERFIIDG